MNKVLQASWVIAEDSFLMKSLQKEIRWHEVWELWWPNTIPNNAITEQILQENLCCFSQDGWSLHLAETRKPIHSLPAQQ